LTGRRHTGSILVRSWSREHARPPKRARIDVFTDPDVVLATSALPSGVSAMQTPEGLRISARWQIASGCQDSTWSNLVVPVEA
jgi:hypothetical protein